MKNKWWSEGYPFNKAFYDNSQENKHHRELQKPIKFSKDGCIHPTQTLKEVACDGPINRGHRCWKCDLSLQTRHYGFNPKKYVKEMSK